MLKLDFENDIKNEVIRLLPRDLISANELISLSSSDLLIIFFNWQERLIPLQNYQIHISKELSIGLKSEHSEFEPVIESIKSKLENGESIHPHLSTGIKTIYQPKTEPKRLNKRRDLDLMLNDWGIHHLHLSNKIEENGFVSRTSKILFATFRGKEAYFIDIRKHGNNTTIGDWWNEDILKILVENWPDANIIFKLNGITGMSQEVSSEDRRDLRNAGITVPIQIGNEVYFSGSGITAAGVGLKAVQRSNKIRRALREVTEEMQKNPNYISNMIIQTGRRPPKNLDLHFVFLDHGFGLVENNSKVIIRLSH